MDGRLNSSLSINLAQARRKCNLDYSPRCVCFEWLCIDIPIGWHTTWQWWRNRIVIIHNCITFLVLHWFHRHHGRFLLDFFIFAKFIYFYIISFLCLHSNNNVGQSSNVVGDDMMVGKILAWIILLPSHQKQKKNTKFSFFIRISLFCYTLQEFCFIILNIKHTIKM